MADADPRLIEGAPRLVDAARLLVGAGAALSTALVTNRHRTPTVAAAAPTLQRLHSRRLHPRRRRRQRWGRRAPTM